MLFFVSLKPAIPFLFCEVLKPDPLLHFDKTGKSVHRLFFPRFEMVEPSLRE